MASIRKRTRRDGTTSYMVEVRLKGFPPQTATFKRLTDAKKWGQDTESAIRDGRYFKTAEAKRHTLAEMINRYIREVLPTKPKARNQTQQLEWFKAQIGAHTLADISPVMIGQCRDQLLTETTRTKKPRTPATVNRYLAALSHAFTVAVNEWGWLENSPMRKVKRLTEPRGRVRFLSEGPEGELERLTETCRQSSNPYLFTAFTVALSTGMRQAETMGLTWDDVDLHQGRITLHDTKNGERRVVPLVGKALELLKQHPRRLDTTLLFPGKVKKKKPMDLLPGKVKKKKPMDLRTPWETALKQAGIDDFHWHDLRHSTASYLAMNGASLAEIAEVLGHKTLQMVKRYAHLSEAHTAGVVARMNERIFG